MNCKNIQKKLYDYTKGEIFSKDELLIKKHIDECPECKFELEKILKIKKIIKAGIISPSNTLFYDLQSKILGKLNIFDFLQRFKFAFATSLFILFLFTGILWYKNKTDSNNLVDLIYNSYYFIEIEEETNSTDSIYDDIYM